MPQAQVETVDPGTCICGEFIESNLGSAVEPDGSVTVRAIGQQYSFTPQCILVPDRHADHLSRDQRRRRARLADRRHQHQHDAGARLCLHHPARFDEPGDHLMPCHEFCGIGHQGMWGNVKVIDKAAFRSMAAEQPEADLC